MFAELFPQAAEFIGQMDSVGKTVLAILLAMSITSWYLMLQHAWQRVQLRARGQRFLQRFWQANSLAEVEEWLTYSPARDPFGRITTHACNAHQHYRSLPATTLESACSQEEFLTRAIRQALGRESAQLESGLAVLASIGSTSPFIGLFGTVWGIHHALASIAKLGQAQLDVVAGPVGEALIMTAIGLAVAIPAVLAYNALGRSNRIWAAELDGFAHDLHAFLTTGAPLFSQAHALPNVRLSEVR